MGEKTLRNMAKLFLGISLLNVFPPNKVVNIYACMFYFRLTLGEVPIKKKEKNVRISVVKSIREFRKP